MAELAETIGKIEQDVNNIRAAFSTLFRTKGMNLAQRETCNKAEDGFIWWQRSYWAEFIKAMRNEEPDRPATTGL